MRAVFPGSFDPPTLGHLDIIERASPLCGELIVAVLNNPSKTHMFTTDERAAQLTALTTHLTNVRIDTFSGLLSDYVKLREAQAIIRGVRTCADFEYECQMASLNRALYPRAQTLFITAAAGLSHISSAAVKEIAVLGGCLDGLAHPVVQQAIMQKLFTQE